MVLGKFPVPGRSAYLDYSEASISALAVGVGGRCLDSFHSSIISLFSPPVGGDPI